MAFEDVQKLIVKRQDDPQAHILAGNLLFATENYLEALEAYKSANKVLVSV